MTTQIPSHGTREALVAVFSQIGKLTGDLPFAQVGPGERQALGGFLFSGGPRLVNEVAAGLTQGAALFPDVTISGPSLLQAQRETAVWRRLRDQLFRLYNQANDTYLRMQAGTIQVALQVIKQVRLTEALPFGGPTEAQKLGRRQMLV